MISLETYCFPRTTPNLGLIGPFNFIAEFNFIPMSFTIELLSGVEWTIELIFELELAPSVIKRLPLVVKLSKLT
jgi:hypothetical protein